jgi:hypothetical protein
VDKPAHQPDRVLLVEEFDQLPAGHGLQPQRHEYRSLTPADHCHRIHRAGREFLDLDPQNAGATDWRPAGPRRHERRAPARSSPDRRPRPPLQTGYRPRRCWPGLTGLGWRYAGGTGRHHHGDRPGLAVDGDSRRSLLPVSGPLNNDRPSPALTVQWGLDRLGRRCSQCGSAAPSTWAAGASIAGQPTSQRGFAGARRGRSLSTFLRRRGGLITEWSAAMAGVD